MGSAGACGRAWSSLRPRPCCVSRPPSSFALPSSSAVLPSVGGLDLRALYTSSHSRDQHGRVRPTSRRPWPSAAISTPSLGVLTPRNMRHVRWHGGHGHSHGGLHDEEDDARGREVLVGKDAADADRITWLGVYVNVALSAAKGVAGVSFHSAGLLADAVHSMSDLVSDAITLVALKYCAQPPDASQPYGYGKYETIGALSVALLLVGGSLGIVSHSLDSLLLLLEHSSVMQDAATATTTTSSTVAALDARLVELSLDAETIEAVKAVLPTVIMHPEEAASHSHTAMVLHPAAFAIATLSVAAKEMLYRTTIAIGRRINSNVLIANAWHHRSDAVTSVVAMGGIALSLAGMPACDPLAGMLVGGIILKMGGEIGWDAIRELCDAQLPAKTVAKLHAAVQTVVDVSEGEILSVHRLRGRKLGRRLHVDITLTMAESSEITLERACLWKQRVREAVLRDLPRVQDIVIELATTGTGDMPSHDHYD